MLTATLRQSVRPPARPPPQLIPVPMPVPVALTRIHGSLVRIGRTLDPLGLNPDCLSAASEEETSKREGD